MEQLRKEDLEALGVLESWPSAIDALPKIALADDSPPKCDACKAVKVISADCLDPLCIMSLADTVRWVPRLSPRDICLADLPS